MFYQDTMAGSAGDLFIGTPNHDGETGANYSRHPDSSTATAADFVLTAAGRARANGNGVTAILLASATPGSPDYERTIELHFASITSDTIGFCVRANSANPFNAYAVRYSNASTRWEILKFTAAASFTTLATVSNGAAGNVSGTAPTPTGGDTITLKLKVEGSSSTVLTMSITKGGSTCVHQVTDASSPFTAAGQIGYRWFFSASPTDSTLQQIDADSAALLSGAAILLLDLSVIALMLGSEDVSALVAAAASGTLSLQAAKGTLADIAASGSAAAETATAALDALTAARIDGSAPGSLLAPHSASVLTEGAASVSVTAESNVDARANVHAATSAVVATVDAVGDWVLGGFVGGLIHRGRAHSRPTYAGVARAGATYAGTSRGTPSYRGIPRG